MPVSQINKTITPYSGDPPAIGQDQQTFSANAFRKAMHDPVVVEDINQVIGQINAVAGEMNAAITEAVTKANEADQSANDAEASKLHARDYANEAAQIKEDTQTLKEQANQARLDAEAALDAFDDKYLGSKTSDPTLDNDGEPLQEGAFYVNSTTGKIRVFTNGGWVQGIASVAGVESINAIQGAINLKSINGVSLLGEGDIQTATLDGEEALTNKTIVDPILALSGTNGLAGQVPVSQGEGLPPVWGTVNSFGGATVTNPMNADIILTSSSARVQVVTPNTFGRKITLPDAITMKRGGQVFILRNTETEIPVSVVDSSGANVGWVVSGSPTEVHLLANDTSAGAWLLHNGDSASAGGVFLYGQEKSTTSGAIPRRNISLALNPEWYFAIRSGNSSVVDYSIWDGRQFGRTVQFGSATGATSTQPTNDIYHMCVVSSTLVFTCWQDSSSAQFRCRVFSVDVNGALTEGAVVNIASTNNAVQPHCVAIDSSRVLVVWQNNSNQLSAVVISINGTTCTVGAPITVSTTGSSGGWCAVLTTSLAHITSPVGVYAVSISGTMLSVLGTSNFSGLSPIWGIFRASNSQSIVIANDYSATPSRIVAIPVTDTGSVPIIGTASAGLMAGASAQVGVSQLGSTGRAIIISGSGLSGSVAESSFVVVGLVSGIPTILSRGVLPPTLGISITYVSVASGHGMLPLDRASASTSYGNVLQIYKKFVITGGL